MRRGRMLTLCTHFYLTPAEFYPWDSGGPTFLPIASHHSVLGHLYSYNLVYKISLGLS